MQGSPTELADSAHKLAVLSVSQLNSCHAVQSSEECITGTKAIPPASIPRRWQSLLIQVAHLPLALSAWIILEPPPRFLRAKCLASQHTRRTASASMMLCAWDSKEGCLPVSLYAVASRTEKARQLHPARMMAQRRHVILPHRAWRQPPIMRTTKLYTDSVILFVWPKSSDKVLIHVTAVAHCCTQGTSKQAFQS